jgi:hypothetical protein
VILGEIRFGVLLLPEPTEGGQRKQGEYDPVCIRATSSARRSSRNSMR